MSQQSEKADRIYACLARDRVALASIVQEVRISWGSSHGVAEVHSFVQEVVACLLREADVEVGDIRKEKFEPWSLDPWDAADLIEKELSSAKAFYEDETNWVFRRKTPNQSS